MTWGFRVIYFARPWQYEMTHVNPHFKFYSEKHFHLDTLSAHFHPMTLVPGHAYTPPMKACMSLGAWMAPLFSQRFLLCLNFLKCSLY